MAKILGARQGETIAFSFDLGKDVSVSGFVFTIHVKQFPGVASAITRTIALDENNKWSGFLTSTETDALSSAAGTNLWFIYGKAVNSTTGEEKQISPPSVRFTLTQTLDT